MSACPKCNNVIEDAFGLTTCDKCGENFFAGSEDNNEPPEDSQPSESKDFGDFDSDVGDVGDSEEDFSSDVSGEDLQSTDSGSGDESDNLDFPTEDNDSSSDFSSDEFENVEEEEASEVEAQEDSLSSEFESSESESDVSDELSDQVEESGGGDINLSSLVEDVEKNEVPLDDIYYRIEVEGIDSPMVRKKVFSELDDHRLGWKLEDLQVDMGKLVLDNVGSAKAHVVVSAMLGLPVKVVWTQKK